MITVLASSSSEGAPDVPLGSECAQALASVLNTGFRIRDIQSIIGFRVHLYSRQKGRTDAPTATVGRGLGRTGPNNALQLTAYSLRYAPASGSS